MKLNLGTAGKVNEVFRRLANNVCPENRMLRGRGVKKEGENWRFYSTGVWWAGGVRPAFEDRMTRIGQWGYRSLAAS